MASKPDFIIRVCTLLITAFIVIQVIFYWLAQTQHIRLLNSIVLIKNYSGAIRKHLEMTYKMKDMSVTIDAAHGDSNWTDYLPECSPNPPRLVGPLATYKKSPYLEKTELELKYLMPGGHFEPQECRTNQRVAIVIPYRNRASHLRTLLYNLHPMLTRQQLNYTIFVIEQAGTNTFNRGLLMNIGYVEAMKSAEFRCFVFHDVDLIPEDDRIYYGCGNGPRHLSAAIDKFNYRLPYQPIAGGVTQLRQNDIEIINGFSNLYFGWGGEDDDLSARLRNASLKIQRYSMTISRYKMIKHTKEKHNMPNPKRVTLLAAATKRMKTDGINSLKYKVLNITRGTLYTNIQVEIDQKDYAI
ncbi:beta-1,4-N-acetylgalactosaminyltransferase bre-4-like [Ylistrum balloti]|uniref:beta-1,4-N-acetylgalactosaminyltransferase bre-4-like n=1 Tax=Ylistrum balloti TaxID=509963 RepID=UPI002905A0DE|nr:beta-1,4-N-acetylgalactosaminyltransferase bre-4-like [Ylistrum balloti]